MQTKLMTTIHLEQKGTWNCFSFAYDHRDPNLIITIQ
uniref:Uncharacterized protein n=1 Tax=Setaria italica TaxID=4555 RepID=K3XU58_SETIT